MFIVFEGVDGTGKSTQLNRCQTWLEGLGYQVTVCRDPGSTALGDRLRELLLLRSDLEFSLTAEMFLFMAARSQLVEELIGPSLENDRIVLCDRFLLSTVVYQGHGGGLDRDEIWRIGRTATGGLEPDLYLVFDVPLETALKRIGVSTDRMESRGEDYLVAVQRGFLAEAATLASARVIDASGDPAEIHAAIRMLIEPALASRT
jgi:dTMP kinase